MRRITTVKPIFKTGKETPLWVRRVQSLVPWVALLIGSAPLVWALFVFNTWIVLLGLPFQLFALISALFALFGGEKRRNRNWSEYLKLVLTCVTIAVTAYLLYPTLVINKVLRQKYAYKEPKSLLLDIRNFQIEHYFKAKKRPGGAPASGGFRALKPLPPSIPTGKKMPITADMLKRAGWWDFAMRADRLKCQYEARLLSVTSCTIIARCLQNSPPKIKVTKLSLYIDKKGRPRWKW